LAVAGGDPVRLAEGDDPVPSPKGDRVAFLKGQGNWGPPADGSQPASRLFFARGSSESPVWSPDGSALAFVSNRGSLSYIAIWRSESEPIQYLAPSSSLDGWPRWSPDGARIAFLRRPGRGGAPNPPLEPATTPWGIWVAEVSAGQAREIWRSPETRPGSFPRLPAGMFFEWAAGDRLVFSSYQDGWPHLYSLPAAGGAPTLLTPGSFMVEQVALTPDRRTLVYSANAGADKD